MSKYWYRLDNAAMIFPPISDKFSPNTFCMSATLKEKVDWVCSNFSNTQKYIESEKEYLKRISEE